MLSRGLDAAGKTTFVRRLNGSDVETVAPTLGFSIYTFSFKGSAKTPPLLSSLQGAPRPTSDHRALRGSMGALRQGMSRGVVACSSCVGFDCLRVRAGFD